MKHFLTRLTAVGLAGLCVLSAQADNADNEAAAAEQEKAASPED